MNLAVYGPSFPNYWVLQVWDTKFVVILESEAAVKMMSWLSDRVVKVGEWVGDEEALNGTRGEGDSGLQRVLQQPAGRRTSLLKRFSRLQEHYLKVHNCSRSENGFHSASMSNFISAEWEMKVWGRDPKMFESRRKRRNCGNNKVWRRP